MTDIVANICKKQPINATVHRHVINAVAYKTGPKGQDGSSITIYDSVDELPETATNGDLAYIRGDTTEAQEKSDTIFELETIYPQIFLNPVPQNLNDVAPDWEYIFNGYGFIAVSDKFIIMQQMAQGTGQDATPDILFVSVGENQENPDYIYVYLFEDWVETDFIAGWYRLQGETPVKIDYEDIAEILNAEMVSFDTHGVFEETKWLLPYYISDYAWQVTTSASLYIYDNGWKIISSGGGDDGFTTVVDCFDDLPEGDDGDLANVRKDTVVSKELPELEIGTEYPFIYGNPIFRLSDLGTEYFEEYVGLGDNTTAAFSFYPDGEQDGSITVPYVELNQSFEMDGYILQNLWLYIEQDYEFAIDWQTFTIHKGWTYITVKISFDPETGAIQVFDKNMVSATPPITALTTFFGNGVYENAKNIVFDENPFDIHYSGMYEKQNGIWKLINRSNVWNPCTDDVPLPDNNPYILAEDGRYLATEDGKGIIIEPNEPIQQPN